MGKKWAAPHSHLIHFYVLSESFISVVKNSSSGRGCDIDAKWYFINGRKVSATVFPVFRCH